MPAVDEERPHLVASAETVARCVWVEETAMGCYGMLWGSMGLSNESFFIRAVR